MAEHSDAQLHYRFGSYPPRPEIESRLNPNVAPFSPSLYYTQASYQPDAQTGCYYPVYYPDTWVPALEAAGPRTPIPQSKMVHLVSLWKSIIVKELSSEESLEQRLRNYFNDQCSNDSPFTHPLASLIIPPPRYQYINPAITDACLYTLRIPPERSQSIEPQFALSPGGAQGFENNPSCDWLISFWAFLYYSLPPLRLSIAQHSCQEAVCWICELATTFRNLDVGQSEGRAQPVQVNNLCDALLRAGPIASLGLQRDSTESLNDFTDNRPLVRGILCQKIRGLYASSTRRWLRDESAKTSSPGRWLGSRTLSADSFLRRVEKTRDRVTRAVRLREAERRQKLDQRECRTKLHFKFHQVVAYCLHALSKCPNIPRGGPILTGDVEVDFPMISHDATVHPEDRPRFERAADILTMTTETCTECFASHSLRQQSAPASTHSEATAVTINPTETFFLELDHHAWISKGREWSPPPGSSRPLSTASSFSAAPSSSSGLATESVPPPRPSPSASSHKSPAAASPPPCPKLIQDMQTFAQLLQDSLWKSRKVAMSCARCAGSGPSQHIVSTRILHIPPLLSLKIKLESKNPSEGEALNFWRFFRRAIEMPSKRMDATSLSMSPLVRTSLMNTGTTESAKLIGRYYAIRNKPGTDRELTDIKTLITNSLSAERSPLPETIHIGQKSTLLGSGNPWVVSETETATKCSCLDVSCAGVHRYDLLSVICSINHFWNRNQRKALWKIWSQDVARRRALTSRRAYQRGDLRRGRVDKSDESVMMKELEAAEAMFESPLEEDQLIAFVRVPSETASKWILVNGPLTCPVDVADVRSFAQCWKYPCAIFYGRLDILWHQSFISQLPPPPPPLPMPIDLLTPHTLSQTPIAQRATPRFVPLTSQELNSIANNDFAVAIDAEYVVASLVAKSATSILGPLTTPSLGRISLLRANGGVHDGTPFMDYYLHFKENPIDYRTEFSGLVPGDLDLGSTHCLSTQKHVHQVLRYLVEKKCRFIGHDLFNDFRVIGLTVPNDLIIDTVEIYRPSQAARLLSLKFLCYYILNAKIQTSTHDSIEDAHASLMLYRYYQRWVQERSAEEFRQEELTRIYNIGYSTNFRIEDSRH